MQKLMTPEVARALLVDPKTVTRWAAASRIPSTRTPGGHRHFYLEDVEAIVRGEVPGAEVAAARGPLDP
jgi:excisionase family DNA binding protein